MGQETEITLTLNEIVAGYAPVFFTALLISFLITPLNRWLAIRNGIVDWPDLKRKNHLEPVAYLGGVSILLGWLGGVVVSFAVTPHGQDSALHVAQSVSFPWPLVFGATVITVTGLIDDVYGISPRVKIGGQFMAAAAMAMSSQSLGTKLVGDTFAAIGFEVPWLVAYMLGAVLIAMFVVGGCNAMNLLDGLDGLAAGVGSIASVGFLFIAGYVAIHLPDPQTDAVRIVMCLATLGALLGFLPYNFNPANIFMGDAGSLLLGYLCVSTILLYADASHNGPMLVMAGLIVFALPITDTVLAISRRVLQSNPISMADNEHLHHQLLRTCERLNVGPNAHVKLAVLMMYLISAGFALLGCALVLLRWRYVLAAFLTFFGFIFVNAYKSGRRRALLADSQPAVSLAGFDDEDQPTGPIKRQESA